MCDQWRNCYTLLSSRLRAGIYAVSKRFGENLRALRERAGLRTQRALAKRLGLRDASTISHWETGRYLPSPKRIRKLAATLRCGTERFMEGVLTNTTSCAW